ncbi:hypothetical protein JYT15_00235 [Acidimicrobium ferrooxidans]|nr:hypothetical protein [Acidimicrobium ferrooxidans]
MATRLSLAVIDSLIETLKTHRRRIANSKLVIVTIVPQTGHGTDLQILCDGRLLVAGEVTTEGEAHTTKKSEARKKHLLDARRVKASQARIKYVFASNAMYAGWLAGRAEARGVKVRTVPPV